QIAERFGYQLGEFIERIGAQRQRAEREESYRVVAETAPDGIITVDANNTILFANAAAARMFGYAPEELIGAESTLLMPAGVRPLHNGDVTRDAMVVTGQHRHGHELPLEVSFGEYRQAHKHVFVAVIREITERRRLED